MFISLKDELILHGIPELMSHEKGSSYMYAITFTIYIKYSVASILCSYVGEMLLEDVNGQLFSGSCSYSGCNTGHVCIISITT